ncbi:hypothetical protein PIB30_035762 [Stylosanthes scabra]|uniref:Secreted protein n=1 Tax=Stylosanthes scabra TaxID=79078 RepID=A0ABU6SDG6_9FABA|nr:hypothetical protein [Stylosanthes scabra]
MLLLSALISVMLPLPNLIKLRFLLLVHTDGLARAVAAFVARSPSMTGIEHDDASKIKERGCYGGRCLKDLPAASMLQWKSCGSIPSPVFLANSCARMFPARGVHVKPQQGMVALISLRPQE